MTKQLTKSDIMAAVDKSYQRFTRWTFGDLVADVARQLDVEDRTPDHGYIQQVVSETVCWSGNYQSRQSVHANDRVWQRGEVKGW